MNRETNHIQSAYITTFRGYTLNVLANTIMPDNLRKLIKKAVYEVKLPLFEVVKCNKRQAWNKYCSRFIGAVRTITGDTKELQKIITTLEQHLKEK